MKTGIYIPRTYRTACHHDGGVNFTVRVAESDLFIRAETDLTSIALPFLIQLRQDIRSYIDRDISFLTSLTPVAVPDSAPTIIKQMAAAALKFNIGPMAAVAGAISEEIARHLNKFSRQILVENGGDTYIINDQKTTISLCIDQGDPSNELLFELDACPEGIGICTSSGVVGHSFSYGKADAVTVLSCEGYFADGAATALCNMIKNEGDIEKTIGYARNYKEIAGLIIIMNKKIGIFGDLIRIL